MRASKAMLEERQKADEARYDAFMSRVRAGTDSDDVAAELGLNGREASRLRRAVLRGE